MMNAVSSCGFLLGLPGLTYFIRKKKSQKGFALLARAMVFPLERLLPLSKPQLARLVKCGVAVGELWVERKFLAN
jgi:hypothetical protein